MPPRTLRGWTLTAVLLAVASACTSSPVTEPLASPVLTKGGGGGNGGGGSGEITVSAVEPSSAPQDTTLDVKVSGANFDRDSWVELARAGATSELIRTNSVRYVNAKQLIASITIAAAADPGAYDVVVTSGPRKPGIGTEMFEVKVTGPIINPTAVFTFHDRTSASGGGIWGDGRAASGTAIATPDGSRSPLAVYDDGQCGVTSGIFEHRVGDATMDPIGGKANRKNCAGHALGARSLTVSFGTPLAGPALAPATHGHFTNVRRVLGVITGSEERPFRLMVRHHGGCPYLRYGTVSGGGDAQALPAAVSGVTVVSSPIRVTRVAQGDLLPGEVAAWIAESQPDPSGRHVALCESGGSLNDPPSVGTILGAYDVPLKIRVAQK